MLKRIITSVVAVCVLVPVLIFSATPVLPIALAVVTVIALFEMFKCMGMHKKLELILVPTLVAIALPILLRTVDATATVMSICFIAAVLQLIITFIGIVWSHGKLAFSDGMAVFTVSVYIIAAMNSILYVRDFGDSGKYVYLLIFIGAWITDIFAYFVGMFFGKHKLIEDVSPKKTVEGSIGGTVFCAIFFVVFGIVIDVFFDRSANILFLALSGIVVSVISQVGDLIMSVIKRHYGIKDYGKIFPGHGGVLDRFDSVLAVSLGMSAICVLAQLLEIQLL